MDIEKGLFFGFTFHMYYYRLLKTQHSIRRIGYHYWLVLWLRVGYPLGLLPCMLAKARTLANVQTEFLFMRVRRRLSMTYSVLHCRDFKTTIILDI